MITEEQFASLIKRMEGNTLDFKRDKYDLLDRRNQLCFVKDVLCMANTPREENSFIVLGIKKYANGRTELVGVKDHDDEADLQDQFSERVYPIPQFSYEIVSFQGKSFGVIVIPPVRIGPCIPIKDFENILRKRQTYIRRGSMNDIADSEDGKRIYEWMSGSSASVVEAESHSENWQEFVDSVQGFEPSSHYVLVTNVPDRLLDNGSEWLGAVDWSFVIDFDPESDQKGLFQAIRSRLESRRSIRMVVKGEKPTLNLGRGTYWFFARGLAGSDESIELGPWRQWHRAYGNEVREQIINLAKASIPTPVTVVALWYSEGMTDHLQTVFSDILLAYGDARLVVATDISSEPQLEAVADRTDGTLIQIPLHHICSGLETIISDDLEPDSDSVILPSSTGAPIPIDVSDLNWIETEIELVHLNAGLHMDHERDTGVDFLKGNQITWHELGLQYDVERDISGQLLQQVQSDLSKRRNVRINLYHAPGAGGTTVARRLIWNMHRSYPSGILSSSRPRETVVRIQKIVTLTRLPMLLLADGSEVSSGELDELFDYVKASNVPVVIVQVLRSFKSNRAYPSNVRAGLRTQFLGGQLSTAESNRFVHILSREAPPRTAALKSISRNVPTHLHTPFYYCLQAFGKDFTRLDSYVASRLIELTDTQKEILAYLSIAHHYGQKSIPAQSFAHLLGMSQNRKVDLSKALSDRGLDLVVELANGEWRTAHDLIAREILEQLLWPNSSNRENWKQHLSSWAAKFARFCRGNSPVPSDLTLAIVQRTFYYRANDEMLGTERAATRQFAPILDDIPAKEGRLEVLRLLTQEYPEEAHFWAHLGRFYAMEMRHFPDAVKCVDHALSLKPEDSLLHHMKGMGLRFHADSLIEQREDVSKIIPVAEQACESFAGSREMNPDNEHGYISEVQLVSKVLEYAGRGHQQGLLGYVKNPSAEPFLQRSLERSEDLLEQVRRNREGGEPSSYELDCRGKLDRLYGRHDDALQVWDNLLGSGEVYRPPVRRQIVRTYLARRGRSWDELPERELARAAELLEENLFEEPGNDRNMRMWIQAIRRVSDPPSIESVIEKAAYWQVNAGSIDAIYYLYVLNAVLALEGFVLAGEKAERYLIDCRKRAQLRRNRTKSFEWIGLGSGLTRLVHQSRLGKWNQSTDFWENTKPLARVKGRITRIQRSESGQIGVVGGLSAFFVPAKGDFAVGRSENQAVDFYLGFSYDGLRAWDVKPV